MIRVEQNIFTDRIVMTSYRLDNMRKFTVTQIYFSDFT